MPALPPSQDAAPPRPKLRANSPYMGLAACVGFDLGLGALLLAGGTPRISSPSFGALREAGGYLPTGLACLGVGALLALAPFLSRSLTSLALVLAALVHLALAAGFLVTLLEEPPPLFPDMPRAALIGPWPWLFAAVIHVIVRFPFRGRGRARSTDGRSVA